ncbi:MAG: pilus assembly protein CpaE [Anaerolineae bacterium]
MISISLARELKQAGLAWHPQSGDGFMIPDRGLDDKVFYITDMAVWVQTVQGFPTILFQGATEWALDYIWLSEVVWLPSETQIREEIERHLPQTEAPALRLTSARGGYVCEITYRGDYQTFSGDEAVTAYGQALLHILAHP